MDIISYRENEVWNLMGKIRHFKQTVPRCPGAQGPMLTVWGSADHRPADGPSGPCNAVASP